MGTRIGCAPAANCGVTPWDSPLCQNMSERQLFKNASATGSDNMGYSNSIFSHQATHSILVFMDNSIFISEFILT